MKSLTPVLVMLAVLTAAPPLAHAATLGRTDGLARDVERAESIRAIKALQRTYAQYGQFGLWRDMAGVFTPDGAYTFDTSTVRGRAAIAKDLAERYGDGLYGLPKGAVHTMMIDAPVINLSADGRTGKGRWHVLVFMGAKGKASIEGGIFENDYVRQDGAWKIASQHYYPQYTGPYETGWTNWGGGDLPLAPYHFTPTQAGVPIPTPDGPAPPSKASLASLEDRIQTMVDESRVRNLQSAYGYYVDRKMWDDVVDLFAPGSMLEIGGVGVYRGRAGVRRALGRMGPAGLTHGQLNDHPQFDTVVTIAPGGREAFARGIQLGMLGEADKGEASWEIAVIQNRYVKDAGIWKIREMRIFPTLKSDYHQGWGKSRIIDPPLAPAFRPDRPIPPGDAGAQGEVMPAFLKGVGRAPSAPAGLKLVANTPLTRPIVSPLRASGGADLRVEEARRKLSIAAAYDGVENISTAYSEYLDDFQSPLMGSLIAAKGFKVSAFAGYYFGPERVTRAAIIVWGQPPTTRPGISYHWRIQPVINIAEDGRSAAVQVRLFQPRTSKELSKPGAFYGAGFHAGMYHDQMVLEGGVWKMWNLSLDEPYFFSVDWKGGWSAAKDPVAQATPRPSPLLTSNFLPDIPITALGVREEHFRGGTGKTIEWPGILPMWFDYRNPVSGRVPEHYWPTCVPCGYDPGLSMTKNGYLAPPTGPVVDP